MQFPKINVIRQGLWSSWQMPVRTPVRFVLSYELEIHHESEGSSVINGEAIECFDGLISFARPGDLSYSIRSGGSRFHRSFVRFDLENDTTGAWGELLRQIPSHLSLDERSLFLWREFQSYSAERGNELKSLQAEMALCSLLIYLSEQKGSGLGCARQPSAHQRALFGTICYMREHLSENLSVGEIAHHIGYSTSHFNHLFKTYTRITPHAYYLSLRMSEARRLLAHTAMSVSEVAEQLCFGNVGKFCRAFKADCDMTPRQFRRLCEQGHDAAVMRRLLSADTRLS